MSRRRKKYRQQHSQLLETSAPPYSDTSGKVMGFRGPLPLIDTVKTGFSDDGQPPVKVILPYDQTCNGTKVGQGMFGAGYNSNSADKQDSKSSKSDAFGWTDDDWFNDSKGVFGATSGHVKKPDVPPVLFSPYAWSKLCYLRDKGSTEVGGYLLMSSPSHLHVADILMVKQKCSTVTVKFYPPSIAEMKEKTLEKGISMLQWMPFWAHTHPGNSATPSGVDEDCFADPDSFGGMDYAMMFILAKDGSVSCRLRYNKGPGMAIEIHGNVHIDYSKPFLGTDFATWDKEYSDCVNVISQTYTGTRYTNSSIVSSSSATNPNNRVIVPFTVDKNKKGTDAKSQPAEDRQKRAWAWWLNRQKGNGTLLLPDKSDMTTSTPKALVSGDSQLVLPSAYANDFEAYEDYLFDDLHLLSGAFAHA